MSGLNDEEALLVQTVRAFVDREVKPTVREMEHANSYPEAWIEQTKRIGLEYATQIPGQTTKISCIVPGGGVLMRFTSRSLCRADLRGERALSGPTL